MKKIIITQTEYEAFKKFQNADVNVEIVDDEKAIVKEVEKPIVPVTAIKNDVALKKAPPINVVEKIVVETKVTPEKDIATLTDELKLARAENLKWSELFDSAVDKNKPSMELREGWGKQGK